MKNWPLSAKLTAWSALIVGIGVLGCALASLLYLQHEQVEDLDAEMNRSVKRFLEAWHAAKSEAERQVYQLALVSSGSSKRLLELEDADGRVLFRSPDLSDQDLMALRANRKTIDRPDDRYRVLRTNRGGLVLRMAASLGEVDHDAPERATAVMPVLPILIALALFGGWWIAQKALSPIHAITVAAEKSTAERLQRLPPPAFKDEIGRLILVLNGMFDRLDKSFRQAKRFSADASHELKTPLTVLRAGLEDLLESTTLRPTDRRAVAGLLEQTLRLSRIVESLLLLSRADAGKLGLDVRVADLVGLIASCLEDAQIVADRRSICLQSELPERLLAPVDAGRFEQILTNLFENAIKYNRNGGRVRVTTTLDPASATVAVTVGNTGPAIAVEDAPHIFERFFRGELNSRASGHGLGLSLARELARSHKGDLILVSSSPDWTEFRLSLPAWDGRKPRSTGIRTVA